MAEADAYEHNIAILLRRPVFDARCIGYRKRDYIINLEAAAGDHMFQSIIGICLIFLSVFLPSSVVTGQNFVDFPAGNDNTPSQRLRGNIRTVLTTEQREERVFSTQVDTYDEKGRIIESLRSNASIEVHSGQLVRLGGKSTFIYDASGRLARENNFDPEGKLYQYQLFKYDQGGRLLEISRFGADGSSRGWIRHAYNNEKCEVEVSWVFSYGDEKGNTPPTRSVLKYDNEHRWAARTFMGDTTTFNYDKDGNLMKESHPGAEGGYGHIYAYKFDRYGNWIERQNSYFQSGGKNQSPNWMHEYRIITYYPEASIK